METNLSESHLEVFGVQFGTVADRQVLYIPGGNLDESPVRQIAGAANVQQFEVLCVFGQRFQYIVCVCVLYDCRREV